MAHESFEDDATAAYLNEHYVAIKVDREERPDVDAIYMQATQAMTGQGGWPMTVVLDHDGAPFFAGTYFPDTPRHGQPSFRQILEALSQAWTERPDEVRRVAASLRERLDGTGCPPAPTRSTPPCWTRRTPGCAPGLRRRSTAASARRRSSRPRWRGVPASARGAHRGRTRRCSTRP